MPTKDSIEWDLGTTNANQMFLLHDAVMEIWLQVTKGDGTPLVGMYTPSAVVGVRHQPPRGPPGPPGVASTSAGAASTSAGAASVEGAGEELSILQRAARNVRSALRSNSLDGGDLPPRPAPPANSPAAVDVPVVDVPVPVPVQLGFTNNILHTLFDEFELSFNEQPLSPIVPGYHMRAYLFNMMQSSRWGKKTWLQAQG